MQEVAVSVESGNKESRRIYLTGTFEENNIQTIVEKIIEINEKDNEKAKTVVGYERKPIELYINSYGGSVYDCIGLINIMDLSVTPIHTFVLTKAMSAGFITFIAGHKRFVHPRATLMCHDMAYMGWGKHAEIKERVEQMEVMWKVLEEIILDRTKITSKKLEKMLERKEDWFMFGKESIKYGVADGLIEHKKE